MSDIRVEHAELLRFFTDLFVAKGMTHDGAATVAEVLAWANLRGVDSHGAVRVQSYLDQIRKGEFDPKAQPKLRRSCPPPSCSTARRRPGRCPFSPPAPPPTASPASPAAASASGATR